MVARDCRPGSPPDGTVRADRRSRNSFGRAAPAWPAQEAVLRGLFPGLEPDPLAQLVGRGLPGPAEVAVQLEAQLAFVPAGVGTQELPGDLGVPALALAPAGALGDLQFQVHADVEGHDGGAHHLAV